MFARGVFGSNAKRSRRSSAPDTPAEAQAARQRARQNLPKSCGLYAADSKTSQGSHGAAPRDAPASTPTLIADGRSAPVRVVLDTNIVLDWLVFARRRRPRAVRRGHRETAACVAGVAAHARRAAGCAAPAARPALGPRPRACANYRLSARLASMCTEPVTAGAADCVCRDPDDQVFIDLARAARAGRAADPRPRAAGAAPARSGLRRA